MTAAYIDTQPHLLAKWSDLNPMGRIGRPDELRGVITWLASDASTFCTGSEYVETLNSPSSPLTLSLQHHRRWGAPCMVKKRRILDCNCSEHVLTTQLFARKCERMNSKHVRNLILSDVQTRCSDSSVMVLQQAIYHNTGSSCRSQ